jgi:drug/metabolite transporter (DMT)-like permease
MQDGRTGIPLWPDRRANHHARNPLPAETFPKEQDVSADVGITPSLRQERIPLAIAYMVAAGLVFGATMAASKWLVAIYPIGEVLWTRTFFGLIACSLFILPINGLATFRTRRLGAHVMRGVSQTCSQSLLLTAFSMMPLASATAINFSSPLFATLASAVFLKERIGAARAIALAVGFLGVLIVTRPGPDTFQIGALFALANAVLFGTVTAGVRGMTATESAETLTMYQLVFLSCAYSLMLPLGFAMPTSGDGAMMILNGAANGLAQYWWTRALHMAPTAAVVPFNYLSLVWAVLFGFAIWGDVPTIGLLIGSAVVVGSGLFLLWHESRRASAVEADVVA